jgi:hypothetical protein
MTKLDPVEKFSLAIRKNVRDEWESKQEEHQAKLTELLGTEWTVEADLKQIYAYAQDGYAKDSLGSCVNEYFSDAIRRLEEFIEFNGEAVIAEINTIAHTHILALDVDEEKRFPYSGGDVADGKLRILFEPDYLGTNIGNSFQRDNLSAALNTTEDPLREETGLSFKARLSKRSDYDPKVEEVRTQIGEALANPDIKLTPNLEDTFAKLSAESKVKGNGLDARHWEAQVPAWTLKYFEGLLSQLKWQKFDSDDMLQEGFNEVVDKSEIAFRIVDKLKFKSYCEFEIEDGVFYLQVSRLYPFDAEAIDSFLLT